jgi:alpha-glucosidase
MLSLYREALRVRRASTALGRGTLRWVSAPDEADDLLVLDMVGQGSTVRVVVNLSGGAIDLPEGELLLASQPVSAGQLPAIAAAWVALPPAPSIADRLISAVGDLTGAIPIVPTLRPGG